MTAGEPRPQGANVRGWFSEHRVVRSLGRMLSLAWVVVVVGACCCTGLAIVGYNVLFDTYVDPLLMVVVMAPMGALMSLVLWKVLRLTAHSIDTLGDGLHRVAAGDFSVRLETKGVLGPSRPMYEDFNKMAENLESNELLRKGFVADFSHEFKTPINSINGFALLLLDNLEGRVQLDEQERETYLRTIASESERLANLSTNTLLLNRLDSQAILEGSDTFRLDEQVRECLVLMQRSWMEKDLELDVDLDETEVVANRAMLKEVWINLIGNAIKFTSDGGTLGVCLRAGDGQVRVAVRDTGIGMDEAVRARVFDRYYQGDPSHATQGHGLGLAIAQRIVELSGGTIEVESAPNQGTVFTVTLPLT